LHLHLPNPSAFWAATPQLRSIPWVTHWHSDVVTSAAGPLMKSAYKLYRIPERHVLRTSAAIIATSPSYLAASAALHPWRRKCHVVPLGLDPGRLPSPDRQALTWAEEAWGGGLLRVLAIGRLTYYKGFEVLLRAVAKTPGVQLRLVGEGDLRPKLERLLVDLGLSGRAQMTGFLPEPELHVLLETCDCLCLPSVERTEAFGMVLLEGMRYGKPLVASDIPGAGMGWVVRSGPCGLLVQPDDADQLSAALAQLRDQPELRERLGRAGRQAFQSRFHIDRISAEISSVYEEVLEEVKHARGGRRSAEC
jgi:rhamnosyl/mannosyltransferase